jgi:hypothetical protein
MTPGESISARNPFSSNPLAPESRAINGLAERVPESSIPSGRCVWQIPCARFQRRLYKGDDDDS